MRRRFSSPGSLVLINTYQPAIQRCFSLITNQHQSEAATQKSINQQDIVSKEVNSTLCIASIPVLTWRESVTEVDATPCCYRDEHNIIRLMVENVFMKNMF
jgi:hypothetical protein